MQLPAAIWGIEYAIVSFHCQIVGVNEMNKKSIFVIAVLLIVLLLVGAAIVDAKSKGGGGSRSGGSGKSFSSALSSSSAKDTAVKIVGVSGLTALGKGTKKIHHDDDLFENETENGTAEQSPNAGVLPVFLAVGMLFMAGRCRRS
jgi:preprotein translocase subunit SecG